MFTDVVLNDGSILDREKISELANYIINKFADEKLSSAEGKEILERTKSVIDENSVIVRIRDS